jgi:hypothetical protein
MDSTLVTIFLVLGLGIGWLVMFLLKANREAAKRGKFHSVKEELFGKKRKQKTKESWGLDG